MLGLTVCYQTSFIFYKISTDTREIIDKKRVKGADEF